MEIRHFPPAGQYLAGIHSTNGGECRCNPTRKVIYKPTARSRFGRHQGNTIAKIEWHHNFIEPTPAPAPEPGLFLFADDRAFAAREDVALAKLAG